MSAPGAVREHGILFSGEMVRAILADAKTVTRRMSERWLRVKAGDVLWVRETWGIGGARFVDPCINYRVDGAQVNVFKDRGSPDIWWVGGDGGRPVASSYLIEIGNGWRNPMFMPHWASRITLEATENARLERLADITEEEAIREGIETAGAGTLFMNYGTENMREPDWFFDPRESFRSLWNSLHAKDTPWASNPEVVRLAFRRLE